MKRLTITLVLILAACAASAQGVPSPATPRLMIDSTGKLVDSTNPLPVTTAGGAPPAAPDVASTTTVSTSGTATTITALSGRQNISLFNTATETIWVGFDVATPAVSLGVPIYSGGFFSCDVDAAVDVTAISSSPSTLQVLQLGY